ncbi:probable glycoprotein hormone G-protein coupled receptor [Porites lutea]|uniref:probable glycoprotein hormone G-protein coupled receptor n=1 Tax=Porites lutea TaxID=51062 RepID=UPI003CC64B6D
MLRAGLVLLMLAVLGKGEECRTHTKCDNCSEVELRCSGLNSFPTLKDIPNNTRYLRIMQSSFSKIPAGVLRQRKKLTILILSNNDIKEVEDGAFDGLENLFEINLDHNRLEKFPVFKTKSPLKQLYLNNNNIKTLPRMSLKNLPELMNLKLDNTEITEIPAYMFSNNKKLLSLSLQYSSLSKIDENAFTDSILQTLILKGTKITSLSATGLDNLRVLNLEKIDNFWSIPSGLSSISEVYVSEYNSFLCCSFFRGTYQRDVGRQVKGVVSLSSTNSPSTIPSTSSTANIHTSSPNGNKTTPSKITTTKSPWEWGKRRRRDFWGFVTDAPTVNGSSGGVNANSSANSTSPPKLTTPTSNGGFNGGSFPEGGFATGKVKHPRTITHENTTNTSAPIVTAPPLDDVICLPERDAYHPCEDIMGAKWLTAISLIVGTVALVANLVVIIVMLTSDRRLNVHRFLMSNLAFADFCLGLYIFILVCVSLDTSGEYYNHVKAWQYGAGCKITGFLAVFSTELSVYTLTVITVERFFAIVYAMEVNYRLSLRKAVKIMISGWLFAFLMAIIPLAGVNSYQRVAICLPFDSDTKSALAFVGIALVLNLGAFLVIGGLYTKMFQVVVGPGPVDGGPQRNDAKVAKRMALLVFTDFVCWTPIAFFGLVAALWKPLIGVKESKFLLVFFFPLNSLCNPFLYAFFTKAFKREFFSLLSRFGFCKTRALRYKGTLSSLIYSRSRTKRSTIAEDDTRSKRISQISATSANTDLRPSTNESPKGEVCENGNCLGTVHECIPMKGVGNPGFGDDSPVSPASDNVFFDPATKAESTSPNASIQGLCEQTDAEDKTDKGDSQLITRAESFGSFHAVEGKVGEKRSKKQSVSFRDQPCHTGNN